jgi:hypothetical protein
MNGKHSDTLAHRSEDLVSRLRAKAAKGGIIPIHDVTIEEAADEIERLRNEVGELRTANAIWEQTNAR